MISVCLMGLMKITWVIVTKDIVGYETYLPSLEISCVLGSLI